MVQAMNGKPYIDASDSYLISVIAPVYNAEKYLNKCIESVIHQTYKNVELILINDGSTDNSADICNEYALSDNRIKVISTSNNGPGAARNIGIENSKGDFIFFVDADDFIEKNALNLLIEKYDQCKADVIVGDFKKIKDDVFNSGHERVFSTSKLLTKQDIVDYTRSYLKKPNRFPLFAYSWGRLFKSSIIKENNILFNSDLRTFEDVAFNFDYLNYTNKIYFSEESIYNHLLHDNYSSATMMLSDKPKHLLGFRQALVNISSFLEKCNSGADIRKEVGHSDVFLTIIQLVRACGQINNSNKRRIYKLIHGIINDPSFRGNLRFYSPSKGDSRLLPFLIKLKLAWAIILVCRHKAHRRYGKGRVAK